MKINIKTIFILFTLSLSFMIRSGYSQQNGVNNSESLITGEFQNQTIYFDSVSASYNSNWDNGILLYF